MGHRGRHCERDLRTLFGTIDIEDNGTDARVRVGDKVAIKWKTSKNSIRGGDHEAHLVLPGLVHARGATHLDNVGEPCQRRGVSLDHTGDNAYECSGENHMAPACGGRPVLARPGELYRICLHGAKARACSA